MKRTLLTAAAVAALIAPATLAVEGMWTPDQIDQIAADMQRLGLQMDPSQLADLTAFPMGAVISLGGCSASFVSPQGLVVTNHHCAVGSIQFNSTPENNYLEEGFLAAAKADEVPAAPGSRVYVTVAYDDVTADVIGGLDADLTGRARYDAIEANRKAMVAACEEDPGHRCSIASFHGGAQYYQIKQLEIQDVRLVYAPAMSVGKYGGDIDNWMWPRHTGDFTFMRAYVAPDGSPAAYAEENVPFVPEHFLSVSAGGLEEGDFVMVAGYPGSTSRYRRGSEVEHTFGFTLPTYETIVAEWIATIEAAAPEGSEARLKYETNLAGLNNWLKNTGGQLEGAARVGLQERRETREADLDAWIAADRARASYAAAIEDLDAIIAESNAANKTNFYYNNATRSTMLSTAQRLYRNAIEQEKPDAERESGFQERDRSRMVQSMEAMERRFDPAVDKAVWMMFVEKYAAQPADVRVAELDAALGLDGDFDAEALSAAMDGWYAATELATSEGRLAWMEKSKADFEASNDPFIRMAVALFARDMADEDASKERAGRLQAARPKYMEAIIAFNEAQGKPVYPDANSTLRITYGNVMGGSPMDGMEYRAFTTLEGITQKDTGVEPFNAPVEQLDLIAEADYGEYELGAINSVPVNFLSDLDVTGGNSGSATLNGRGELVGLLFDGTLESVNSDWDFDPRTTRSIHVDTRYMLWVMDKLDDADHLIEEMTIVRDSDALGN